MVSLAPIRAIRLRVALTDSIRSSSTRAVSTLMICPLTHAIPHRLVRLDPYDLRPHAVRHVRVRDLHPHLALDPSATTDPGGVERDDIGVLVKPAHPGLGDRYRPVGIDVEQGLELHVVHREPARQVEAQGELHLRAGDRWVVLVSHCHASFNVMFRICITHAEIAAKSSPSPEVLSRSALNSTENVL